MTATATQTAREKQVERAEQQLLSEGCPESLVLAYRGAPELARQHWAAMKAAPIDPERQRAIDYEAQIKRQMAEEMAEHKAKIAEQRAVEARRGLPPDDDQIAAVEADAARRYGELLPEIRSLAPMAVVDTDARFALEAARSQAAACRTITGGAAAPEETLGLAELAREEIGRRRGEAERQREAQELKEEEARRLARFGQRRAS